MNIKGSIETEAVLPVAVLWLPVLVLNIALSLVAVLRSPEERNLAGLSSESECLTRIKIRQANAVKRAVEAARSVNYLEALAKDSAKPG